MRIALGRPAPLAGTYGIKPAGSGGASPSAAIRPPGPAAGQLDAPRLGQTGQRLVAGIVGRPITFEADARPTTTHGAPLPFYTRAADKTEAAVAVHLGRMIDVSA